MSGSGTAGPSGLSVPLVPRTVAVVTAVALLALAGCSRGLDVTMSEPEPLAPAASVTPAGDPASQDPADPQASDEPTDAPSDVPAEEPSASPEPAARWGGGRKVGRSATRGTVVGDDGSGPEKRIVVGTCDAARDVRTVTAPLPGGGLLVVDVTSANLAKITLTAPGEPKRSVEYVGDATPVVTLTPQRTIVRSALLVPPAGSDAPPVRVDATFDC